MLLFAGCKNEFEDNESGNLIDPFEQRVSEMEVVMKAYNDKLLIDSIIQNENGYLVTFSDGSQVTIVNTTINQPGVDSKIYIQDVSIGEDMVTFILTDGSTFSIPFLSTLSIEFDTEDLVVVDANSTFDIHYTVKSILTDIKFFWF